MGARLNLALLRERIPNTSAAARRAGLRPATISDLCTGKTSIAEAKVKTLKALADLAHCHMDDLVIDEPDAEESFAASIRRWNQSGDGAYIVGGPQTADPIPVERAVAALHIFPKTGGGERSVSPERENGYAI